MISLVNAARLRAGRSSVGWIHPILYASYKNFTKDITSGNNNCARAQSPSVCCPQGFSAAPGWDPVSGLGVLNFKLFKTFMMSIGTNSSTTTSKPSFAPSLKSSNLPSNTPSLAPSYAPLGKSSSAPSVKSSMIGLSLSVLCVLAATDLVTTVLC